jgi:superfamily II DNA/RNA helicase
MIDQTLKHTFTALVLPLYISFSSKVNCVPGRTGRFGRKGISINFVHDRKTWLQMEQIEKALGKKIIRIETNDLDEMEEVSTYIFRADR